MTNTTFYIEGLPIVYSVVYSNAVYQFEPVDILWQCSYPAFTVAMQDGVWQKDNIQPKEIEDQVMEEVANLEASATRTNK